MTEKQYILVSNRVRINTAITALREVISDEEYGITDEVLNGLIRTLREREARLFSMIMLEKDKNAK